MLEYFWSKTKRKTVLLPATEGMLSAAIVNIPGKMPVMCYCCVLVPPLFLNIKCQFACLSAKITALLIHDQ